MTQEEAEKLLTRIKEFKTRENREPSLTSPSGREVRLAELVASRVVSQKAPMAANKAAYIR